MFDYPIHTVESAPEESKPSLQGLEKAFGLIPNLAATMASSPALVKSFVAAFGNFHGGTFSGAEKQALLLTNAVTNRAPWPVAFHSTMALKEGVSADDVEAIRAGRLPRNEKLAALSRLSRALIEARGHVPEAELAAFAEAGFRAEQVLEVITGIGISTMANYAASVAKPALEKPFQPQAWR